MKRDERRGVGMDRRDFLKGAALVGGVAATAGLAGCTTGGDGDTGGGGKAEGFDAAAAKYPALKNGSREIDWLGAPPDVTVDDCVETVDGYDVVVIGTAVAGELAGFSALREGAKVVMLERNGTAHVSGSGIGFINSKFQLDAGQEPFDEYEVIQRLFTQCQGRADLSFISQWAFNSGAVLDEIEQVVLGPGGCPGTPQVAPPHVGQEQEIMQNITSFVNFNDQGEDSLENMNFCIHDWIEANGGRIDYNTTGRVLTQAADGRVTGVIATNPAGEYVYYPAAKGVIVCTGSYGGNEEMMEAFAPPWQAYYAKNYGVYNARVSERTPITTSEKMDDGTGHKMMCWAGAAMEEIDPSFQSWEGTGFWWFPYLQVTCKGERFRNESCTWLQHTHLIAERPEGVNYYWQIVPTNDFDMPNYMGFPFSSKDREKGLQEGGETEWHEADTIEELAKKIGAEPDVLVATVERYNKVCAAGFDADWGKLPKYLDPIVGAPYKAYKATINFYCTSGGVKCNSRLQVLDKDWQPIEGLFAAGNTVGWRLGSNYPMLIPGMCNAYAFFHGYVAGKAACNPGWVIDDLKK